MHVVYVVYVVYVVHVVIPFHAQISSPIIHLPIYAC